MTKEEGSGEWRKLFNKHYSLKSSTDQPLQACGSIDYMDCQPNDSQIFVDNVRKQMAELKDELNYTKSLLNDYDIKKWNEHTYARNLCAHLSKGCKQKINAELCTRAWLKFCTILNSYELFEGNNTEGTVTSVHLCEAPGAFVTCLNHHLVTKWPNIEWNWLATTLNPYYDGNSIMAMIDDDRFMKSTLPNWRFGEDFTGNIMNERNLRNLMNECKKIENVALVTADGSIDCFEDPCMQEHHVAPLLYWETITAINIMSIGAAFVIKVFTVLEDFTISLIYLLWQAFSEVNFIKPGPSKPGNSEVYIVCKGFLGTLTLGQKLFDLAMQRTKTHDFNTPLVPLENIQGEFLSKLMECEEFFIRHQILAINSNIDSFQNITRNQRYKMNKLKGQICVDFIANFDLKPLSGSHHICKKYGKQTDIDHYTGEHTHCFSAGNFYERTERKYAPWIERVNLDETSDTTKESKIFWFSNTANDVINCQEDITGWEPVLGKKYKRSGNTLFFSNYIMNALFEARESTYLNKEGKKLVVHGNENHDHDLFSELEIALGQPPFGKITVLQISEEKQCILVNNYQCKSLQEAVTHFRSQSSLLPILTSRGMNSPANNQGSEATNTTVEFICSNLNKTCGNTNERKNTNRELPVLKCILEIVEKERCESRDCVNTLICLSCQSSALKGNETSRLGLLIALSIVLKRLQIGGTLFCEVGDFFTNASAGLFYLFSLIFKRIGIFKGTLDAHQPRRVFVCEDFQEAPSFLIQYVTKLLVTEIQVALGEHGENEVIHVLPIDYIVHDELVKYLRLVNKSHTLAQLRALKCIHLATLQP